MTHSRTPSRRGSVYLLVLSTTTIIATLLAGVLYAQNQSVKSNQLSSDVLTARQAAQSGIEIVRAWIAQDPDWRTANGNGRWSNNLTLGSAIVGLDVTDPTDGNLTNHPYQSVRITATARVGNAEQIMSATLSAKPVPIDALAYALHTTGQIHVRSGHELLIGTATASTNADLRNDNVIDGNVLAATISTRGIVHGAVTTSATPRPLPADTSIDTLIALGTNISTTKLENRTLSPTANPFGAPNPYGIYVVRPTGDLDIKSSTVNGTLIVILPAGKVVKVVGNITITPTSPDYPALVIRGGLLLDHDGTVVLNGLVHATGKVHVKEPATITGALICNQTGNDSVNLEETLQINYSPTLFTRPPVGYAKSVEMILDAGSLQRVIK